MISTGLRAEPSSLQRSTRGWVLVGRRSRGTSAYSRPLLLRGRGNHPRLLGLWPPVGDKRAALTGCTPMLLCGDPDWRFETVFRQDKTNQPDTAFAGGGVAQPNGSSNEPHYI